MYGEYMQTNAGAKEVVAQLVRGGDAGLAHLSDRELLASMRELVGRSNQVFAALLAHLAEVDARGLHRTRACARRGGAPRWSGKAGEAISAATSGNRQR